MMTFTIQKLAELQSKNVLDLPTLPIAEYLNEIELFTFTNIYLVFRLSRRYAKFIGFFKLNSQRRLFLLR